MKNKKYSNGYWDKITYWKEQLDNSIVKQDLRGVDSAHNKLNYFIGKQWKEDERTEVRHILIGDNNK